VHRIGPRISSHAIRGVGLIEVLVAILVLGIGMLGIAALQATTLRSSQGALERSQAVIGTYGIMDSMRANVVAARAEGYDRTMAAPPCAAPVPATLITRDLNAWIGALKADLGPNACGAIDCDPATSVCRVTVQWNSERGNTAPQQLVTVTRL
jgi:type IV pilus assembly protein PilV